MKRFKCCFPPKQSMQAASTGPQTRPAIIHNQSISATQVTSHEESSSSGWWQLGNELPDLPIYSFLNRRSIVGQEEGGARGELVVHGTFGCFQLRLGHTESLKSRLGCYLVQLLALATAGGHHHPALCSMFDVAGDWYGDDLVVKRRSDAREIARERRRGRLAPSSLVQTTLLSHA